MSKPFFDLPHYPTWEVPMFKSKVVGNPGPVKLMEYVVCATANDARIEAQRRRPGYMAGSAMKR